MAGQNKEILALMDEVRTELQRSGNARYAASRALRKARKLLEGGKLEGPRVDAEILVPLTTLGRDVVIGQAPTYMGNMGLMVSNAFWNDLDEPTHFKVTITAVDADGEPWEDR